MQAQDCNIFLDGHASDYINRIGTADGKHVTDLIMDTIENSIPVESTRRFNSSKGRWEYALEYDLITETGVKPLTVAIGDNGFIVSAYFSG